MQLNEKYKLRLAQLTKCLFLEPLKKLSTKKKAL